MVVELGGGPPAGTPIMPSPFKSCWKLISTDSSAVLVPETLESEAESTLPLLSVFQIV